MDEQDIGKKYSDEKFWAKILRYAKVAGKEVIEKALTLYYTMHDKDTPAWAKTIIVGALVYLIMPLDAIPDFIPVVGYSDDLGLLVVALGTVAIHIKPGHKQAAKDKAKEWFGPED